MSFIWATRGRTWGFRFLTHSGFDDPLPEYDRVFSQVEDDPEIYHRDRDIVGLRFPDPLGRKDSVGRVIPHEFVVYGDLACHVHSINDGLQLVWPLVADEFAQIWEESNPPMDLESELTTQPQVHRESHVCETDDQ